MGVSRRIWTAVAARPDLYLLVMGRHHRLQVNTPRQDMQSIVRQYTVPSPLPPDTRAPIRHRVFHPLVHEYGGYFRDPRTLALIHESELA